MSTLPRDASGHLVVRTAYRLCSFFSLSLFFVVHFNAPAYFISRCPGSMAKLVASSQRVCWALVRMAFSLFARVRTFLGIIHFVSGTDFSNRLVSLNHCLASRTKLITIVCKERTESLQLTKKFFSTPSRGLFRWLPWILASRFSPTQHYEKDADGLSTRLQKPVVKQGGREFKVFSFSFSLWIFLLYIYIYIYIYIYWLLLMSNIDR